MKRYESELTAESKKKFEKKKGKKIKINQLAAYFDNNPKAAIKRGAKRHLIPSLRITNEMI